MYFRYIKGNFLPWLAKILECDEGQGNKLSHEYMFPLPELYVSSDTLSLPRKRGKPVLNMPSSPTFQFVL